MCEAKNSQNNHFFGYICSVYELVHFTRMKPYHCILKIFGEMAQILRFESSAMSTLR